LTYKSIREAIKAHEGRALFCLPPEFGGQETPRAVFVSAEVLDIVVGPWSGTWEGQRYARLRGLLDSFTEGDFITIAEDPFDKEATAILARVHPVQAEVWDFRCLDPIPGIRVFGCFAETDAFVALTWDYRENIEDASYWEEQVSRCREEWQKLFGGLAPHHAQELDEYVSYNFRAV
jgi:hypothetical protein